MNTVDFAKLMDEDCALEGDARTIGRKRRLAIRIFSCAAAFLLLLGAAFLFRDKLFKWDNNEVSASIYPEGYDFMAETGVPETAVLPPETNGVPLDMSHARAYTFASAYENADLVCIVTIGDWLEEAEISTFYSAKVNKIYKGEPVDTITILQMGSSSSPDSVAQFSYGDKLLLFLRERTFHIGSTEKEFEIVGADFGNLYLAADKEGQIYCLDFKEELSYESSVAKETLPAKTTAAKVLREELFAYYNNRPALEWFFMNCEYIYTLESVENLLSGMGE